MNEIMGNLVSDVIKSKNCNLRPVRRILSEKLMCPQETFRRIEDVRYIKSACPGLLCLELELYTAELVVALRYTP